MISDPGNVLDTRVKSRFSKSLLAKLGSRYEICVSRLKTEPTKLGSVSQLSKERGLSGVSGCDQNRSTRVASQPALAGQPENIRNNTRIPTYTVTKDSSLVWNRDSTLRLKTILGRQIQIKSLVDAGTLIFHKGKEDVYQSHLYEMECVNCGNLAYKLDPKFRYVICIVTSATTQPAGMCLNILRQQAQVKVDYLIHLDPYGQVVKGIYSVKPR